MPDSDITVLHVDDDEAFADLVAAFLERHDDSITVHTVQSVEAALARLEEIDDVDCVVSDYEMPGLSGLDLLEKVRARWPDLPFILFTGQGSEGIATRTINAGVTDYLQKQARPTQFAILANRIHNAVAWYRAETELQRTARQTETQFELLVETVEDYAIFLLDEEGYIQTWNRGAEKIKGYTRDEIIGEHFSVFYRETDVDAGIPDRNLREARTEGRAVDEGWRVRKDGSWFWADVTITALHSDGDLVGYAKITRDSTQQKRLRDLLAENESLEGFLIAISNDLRDPLSVVGENITSARETGDISRLDAAEEALERATRLLDHLVRLGEEDEPIIDLQPIDLRAVARAAWRVIAAEEATLDIEESLTVRADRSQLQQILENLFGNAVKHAGPDVTVTVGTIDGEGFYVEHDGRDIADAAQDEVFEVTSSPP